MFNLRAKNERNGVYNQIDTFDTLNDVLIHVSKEEYTNGEITKDGKVFFVFTIDEKTKIFLNVIKEISGLNEPEIIPKVKAQRKIRSKNKKVD